MASDALPPGLGLLDVMDLSLEAVRASGAATHAGRLPARRARHDSWSSCRTLDFHMAAEMIALGRGLAVDALADGRQQPGSFALR